MNVLAAIAILLAGCNAVLGLDEAERGGADEDRDGFEDSRDNCPLVANPDQRDADLDRQGDACDSCPLLRPTRDLDGDGVDDACDPCPLGNNHDEDGDGAVDACDVCPGDGDPTQEDRDGDGVGDACEPDDNVFDERVIFDAFAPARTAWGIGTAWQPSEDGDGLVATGAGVTTLADPALALVGARPSISAWVELRSPIAGLAAGVGFRTADGDATCAIECGAACTLVLALPNGTRMAGAVAVPPMAKARLGLTATELGLIRDQLRCTIAGAITDEIVLFTAPRLTNESPLLLGTPGAALFHVDIVR